MNRPVFSLALAALGLTACATDDAAQTQEAPSAEQTAHAEGEHAEGEHHGYKHKGHNPHHRFNEPEKWAARFEDPKRDEWQKPDVVIKALALSETSKVADIGSATGYFPVRMAKVATAGKVYGVDIEQTMVDYLNARAQKEGLANLTSVLGAPDNPNIPEPVNAILIVDTWHHIENRPAYVKRLQSSVVDDGRLVIVDFKQGELPFGPPPAMKIPPDTVVKELAEGGWTVIERDETTLPYQFLLVATKTP